MRALQTKRVLLLFLLSLTASLLWGCRTFPGVPQPPYKEEAEGTPVTLGVTVDPSSPEEVSVIWEPEHVSIMGTEVTVTYTDTGVPRTVTVVLQLEDQP